MMQTRLNNGPIEDSALNQTSESDNRSAKSSSRGTISEALQKPAEGDASPVDKNVRLLSGQKVLENLDDMSAGD